MNKKNNLIILFLILLMLF